MPQTHKCIYQCVGVSDQYSLELELKFYLLNVYMYIYGILLFYYSRLSLLHSYVSIFMYPNIHVHSHYIHTNTYECTHKRSHTLFQTSDVTNLMMTSIFATSYLIYFPSFDFPLLRLFLLLPQTCWSRHLLHFSLLFLSLSWVSPLKVDPTELCRFPLFPLIHMKVKFPNNFEGNCEGAILVPSSFSQAFHATGLTLRPGKKRR